MVNLKKLAESVCAVMDFNGRASICDVYYTDKYRSGTLKLSECSSESGITMVYRGAKISPPVDLAFGAGTKRYDPPFLYELTSFEELLYVNQVGIKVKDAVTFMIGILESCSGEKNHGFMSYIVSVKGKDLRDFYVIYVKTNRFNENLPSVVEGPILKEVVKAYLKKMNPKE